MKDEVYQIVGAALEVANCLGCGFLEAVYQETLELELADRGIPYAAQEEIRILYRINFGAPQLEWKRYANTRGLR